MEPETTIQYEIAKDTPSDVPDTKKPIVITEVKKATISMEYLNAQIQRQQHILDALIKQREDIVKQTGLEVE